MINLDNVYGTFIPGNIYIIKGYVKTNKYAPVFKNSNKTIWEGMNTKEWQCVEVTFMAADESICMCMEDYDAYVDFENSYVIDVSQDLIDAHNSVKDALEDIYSGTLERVFIVSEDWMRGAKEEDEHEGQIYNEYSKTWSWF